MDACCIYTSPVESTQGKPGIILPFTSQLFIPVGTQESAVLTGWAFIAESKSHIKNEQSVVQK